MIDLFVVVIFLILVSTFIDAAVNHTFELLIFFSFLFPIILAVYLCGFSDTDDV